MRMNRVLKKIWVFVLAVVLLAGVSVGGAHLFIQSKLNASGDSTKKEIVNTMMNEMIKHPIETKKMLDSITVTEEQQGKKAPNNSKKANPMKQKAKTAKAPLAADGAVKSKSETIKAIFTTKYIKSHLSEYVLLKSTAKNLGGNTYRLTATVKHKPTGKIGMVSVTTHLSESMKAMLRKYR
jgi:mRNA-degrading endonuclease HigB of HigAB toxin-antitoxin module